ncbi:hypothetical protein Tco_1109913 [Tanacetum coccineum]|uniref:Uncharacterized protein n=1 Tax=Tanacetum coccineum TaxID=301880 RepID=A0ABQ5IIR2_9ASTR
MDEDIPPIDEEVKSPPPNTDKRESSHAQDTMNQILTPLALNSRNTTTFCHSLKDNCTERANLLKALNGVTETLKVVHEAVKDDPALNMKVIKATEAYTKNSTSLSELFTLIKNFDFQGLKSSVESLQATAISYSSTPSSSVPQTTLAITEATTNVGGENITQVDTKEPSSHAEGEHVSMDDDTEKPESEKAKEEPTNTVPISVVKPTETPTPKVQPITTITSTSQPESSQVHKRQHTEKAKRMMELNKKRVEQYKWTIYSRLKLEPALDELGLIIQKKKNIIVKDLMTSLGKRYERLKKILEELGIQSALPAPVLEQDPSQSSRRKRKHMELKPEIKVLGIECNQSLLKGVPFVNNMVNEGPEYVIFFTNVFGDQAFQRWNEIHKVGLDSQVSYLVKASMIKTPENARFCLKLKKLIAKHTDQEKLQSEKVKLESVGYKLD